MKSVALIVKVYINERLIIDTHCVRIKGSPGQLCTYESGDGTIFHHDYDRGGAALAIKLLQLQEDYDDRKHKA